MSSHGADRPRNQLTQPRITSETVVAWFRETHPRLRRLPVVAVQSFADSLALILPPNLPRIPVIADWQARLKRMQPAFGAMQDARRAAVELRTALGKVRRVVMAEGQPCPEIEAIFSALDGYTRLNRPSRGPGAPEVSWDWTVDIFREPIERILRTNGFPRASVTSDDGPAAKVMAKLLEHEGYDVSAATIARHTRAANRTDRERSRVVPTLPDRRA